MPNKSLTLPHLGERTRFVRAFVTYLDHCSQDFNYLSVSRACTYWTGSKQAHQAALRDDKLSFLVAFQFFAPSRGPIGGSVDVYCKCSSISQNNSRQEKGKIINNLSLPYNFLVRLVLLIFRILVRVIVLIIDLSVFKGLFFG